MEDRTKIESLITGKGFSDFRWIASKDIVVAHWVRVKCSFGCSDYELGTCPPNTPSVDDVKLFLGNTIPQ